jgi:trk system potassium uptake protein TrkH
MVHYQTIGKIMGVLLILFGLLMLPGIGFSFYYGSEDKVALVYSALATIFPGTVLYLLFARTNQNIRKRDGFLIVTLSWVLLSMFGMLPYLISGAVDIWPEALFETVSGLTTTGGTIFTDIEALPAGIMIWRSMTHWIGGLGIIVLTVAIFPLLGIGGIELFAAEAPGPTKDKLHPRIRETAKRLWYVYTGLTLILILVFYVEGMSFFDAVNHGFSTMSTGGFSTKNASMAYFESPLIQYTTIIFMFIAGVNFTLIYFSLRGRLDTVWENDEFRAYVAIVLAVTFLLFLPVYFLSTSPAEKAFRDTLFQVVSLITTTGFVTDDYTRYSNGVTIVFFMLLFVGACAGSTSGGIKVIRHLIFVKNAYLELKRMAHPRAVVPLKINGETVRGKIITHIMNFLLIYLMVFVLGSFALALDGYDMLTSFGAAATALGNVGPGIGRIGPIDNFAFFSPFAKVLLSVLMLLGRLELFTVLVLFSPFFWRPN